MKGWSDVPLEQVTDVVVVELDLLRNFEVNTGSHRSKRELCKDWAKSGTRAGSKGERVP